MRCPKCGYHSFDYLDNCKKCGNDLSDLKLRFKFQGYVAPTVSDEVAEPEPEAPELPEEAEAESEAIDFGFDILDEDPGPPPLERAIPVSTGPAEPVPDQDDHFAVDLAADSGLNFDQPFEVEDENLPGDDLPKLDDRFNF